MSSNCFEFGGVEKLLWNLSIGQSCATTVFRLLSWKVIGVMGKIVKFLFSLSSFPSEMKTMRCWGMSLSMSLLFSFNVSVLTCCS